MREPFPLVARLEDRGQGPLETFDLAVDALQGLTGLACVELLAEEGQIVVDAQRFVTVTFPNASTATTL